MSELTVGRIEFDFNDLRGKIGDMVKKYEFKQKESEVLSACLTFLKVKGACPMRHNNGGAWANGHYRAKPKTAGYEPGQPDILACWQGRPLAVECKASKGKQSDEQKAWAKSWRKAGGIYILARSLAGLIDELEATK